MCSLKTEGIQYGCGHYVAIRTTHKDDCGSKYCMHSEKHAPNCPHCPSCHRYFGPDSSETIAERTSQYCNTCQYWWKGQNNAYRR